jgi:hypothetical protein
MSQMLGEEERRVIENARIVRNATLEEAANIVDQCNREGPYNAIGAAERIRARKSLKAASIRTPEAALVEALTKCRDRFREYQQLHLAKMRSPILGVTWSNKISDENRAAGEKAQRNLEMAEMCDAALAQFRASEHGGEIG